MTQGSIFAEMQDRMMKLITSISLFFVSLVTIKTSLIVFKKINCTQVFCPFPNCHHTHTHTHAHTKIIDLAPPQILGNIAGCTSSHLCEQSHPSLNPNSDNQFTVTVEYFGDNVTTVDWQRDGEQIDCSRKQCTMMNMSNGLYHKSVYYNNII